MSMAMQRAKYTGDPGLFGDIWGGIKGVAKVGLGIASQLPIIGTPAKIAQSVLFRPAPGTTTYAQMPTGTPMPRFPTGMPGVGPVSEDQFATQCRSEGVADWSKCGRQRYDATQVQKPGIIAAIQAAIPGGQTGMMTIPAMQAGKPCPVQGYHWNKSGYFLLSGEYVYPGTKMVKNRRRNPANPRATSNAITRIKGAKRYAKSLSSISIRKKC